MASVREVIDIILEGNIISMVRSTLFGHACIAMITMYGCSETI